MTRPLAFAAIIAFCLAATLALAPAKPAVRATLGSGQDAAAIRELPKQYAGAWNQGDAKKVASIFTPNAVFLAYGGKELKGRAAIEKSLGQVLDGPMKGTSFSVTVDGVQFLKPDVAVAYGSSQIEGGPGSNNKGHYVVTCEKSGGRWRIAAAGTGLDVTQ